MKPSDHRCMVCRHGVREWLLGFQMEGSSCVIDRICRPEMKAWYTKDISLPPGRRAVHRIMHA